MNEEDAFIRAIIASPNDPAIRLIYADWLEEREPEKARWMRNVAADPERWIWPPDVCYGWEEYERAAWTALSGINREEGGLPAARHPRHWRGEPHKRRANEPPLDEPWWLLMATLGEPFQPFLFYRDVARWSFGQPSMTGPDFSPDSLPFAERLGVRGTVVTFESSLRSGDPWGSGVLDDLDFLYGSHADYELGLGTRYFRGTNTQAPVFPCIVDLPALDRPLVRADVIDALKIRPMRPPLFDAGPGTSRHWRFTGPAGYSVVDDRDGRAEEGRRPPIVALEPPAGPRSHPPIAARGVIDEAYARVRRYIEQREGDSLWHAVVCGGPYEASHDGPLDGPCDGCEVAGHHSVLFVGGRSPHGDRLVGYITHDFSEYEIPAPATIQST